MTDAKLSVVMPQVRLREAFDVMRERGQSAVLVPARDIFRVVTAGELVTSGKAPNSQIGSIQVVRLAVPARSLGELLPESPTDSTADSRRALRRAGVNLAVIALKGGEARVISGDARSLRTLLVAPTACYCTNPLFNHPQPTDHNGTCDICGYDIACW